MNRPNEVKVQFNPEQVVTVPFNGTDTIYQPRGYVKGFYEDGPGSSETISFVASCVSALYSPEEEYRGFENLTEICPELRLYTDIQKDIVEDAYYGPKLNDLQFDRTVDDPPIRIINGPCTLATDVYKKTAEAVVTIIGSIINGKNIINMTGHSRGGVVPSEVAHELERIKKAMGENSYETDNGRLISLICGEPKERNIEPDEVKTRQALRVIFAKLENGLSDRTEYLNRLLTTIRDKFAVRDGYRSYCKEIWVECLVAVDPVSGNSVLNAPVGWTPKRMFKYSAIIRNVYVLRCTNEDTAGFDSTYLTPTADYTNVKEYLLPGHHGTLTGNEFGNNGEKLDVIVKDYAQITNIEEIAEYADLHARDAQYMALYIIVEHLHAHGTKFVPEANHTYPLAQQYNPYIAALNINDVKAKSLIQYNCYQNIMRNDKAYKLLNHTVYIKVLWNWHETFKEGINCHKTTKSRQVMLNSDYHKTSLAELFPFRSETFKNWHHLQLFMKLRLGIDPSFTPETQLSNLLRFSQHLQDQLIGEESAIQKVQDAIQTIVLSLVSTYITNNLQAKRKQEIIRLINSTLQITIPDDEYHYYTVAPNASTVNNLSDSTVGIVIDRQLTPLGQLKQSLVSGLQDRIRQQIAEKVAEQKERLEKLFLDIHIAQNPAAEKKRIAGEVASNAPTEKREGEEKVEEDVVPRVNEELQQLQVEGERDLIKTMLENNLPSLINRYFDILKFTKHLKDLSKGINEPEADRIRLDGEFDQQGLSPLARVQQLQEYINNSANELNAYAIAQIGANIQNEIISYVQHHRKILDELVSEITATEIWRADENESAEEFQTRKKEAITRTIANISNKYFQLKESIRKVRQLRENPDYIDGLEEEQIQKITGLQVYLREKVQSLELQVFALPSAVTNVVYTICEIELLKTLEAPEGMEEFYRGIKNAWRVREGALNRQDDRVTELMLGNQRLSEEISGLRDSNARLNTSLTSAQTNYRNSNTKVESAQRVVNTYNTASPKPGYSFHILNGFILALGIAAVAIACAILIAQPLAAAAAPSTILGIAGLCTTGLGLYQNRKAGIKTGQFEVGNSVKVELDKTMPVI